MKELINRILEYLGIKDRYRQLNEPEEIFYIHEDTILEANNNLYNDSQIIENHVGENIKNMQIGAGNIKFGKNAEAKQFEQQLRQGLDLEKMQKAQQEIGRKYSTINQEHFNSMGKDAKINMKNSKVLGGTMDLDKANITDSELRNVRTYRGSEEATL